MLTEELWFLSYREGAVFPINFGTAHDMDTAEDKKCLGMGCWKYYFTRGISDLGVLFSVFSAPLFLPLTRLFFAGLGSQNIQGMWEEFGIHVM